MPVPVFLADDESLTPSIESSQIKRKEDLSDKPQPNMAGSSVPYFPQKPLFWVKDRRRKVAGIWRVTGCPPLTPSETESQTHVWCGMGFQAYVQILTLTLRNLLTSLGLPFVSCKRPASLGVFGGGSEIMDLKGGWLSERETVTRPNRYWVQDSEFFFAMSVSMKIPGIYFNQSVEN